MTAKMLSVHHRYSQVDGGLQILFKVILTAESVLGKLNYTSFFLHFEW